MCQEEHFFEVLAQLAAKVHCWPSVYFPQPLPIFSALGAARLHQLEGRQGCGLKMLVSGLYLAEGGEYLGLGGSSPFPL